MTTETTTAAPADDKKSVSVRVLSQGSKEPRYVRGNGDNVFKAMALIDPSKLPAVVKANKLTDKVRAPETYPNHGRYIMTVSNILRAHNKTVPLTIGGITVPPGGKPSKELDEAFEKAVDAADDFFTKKEQARIDASNKKKKDKADAKAKADAVKAKAAAKPAPKVDAKAAAPAKAPKEAKPAKAPKAA